MARPPGGVNSRIVRMSQAQLAAVNRYLDLVDLEQNTSTIDAAIASFVPALPA